MVRRDFASIGPMPVRRRALTLIACSALTGCSDSEAVNPVPDPDPPYVAPPERCDPADVDDPTTFALCNTGRGIFGSWTVDAFGLPAYDYGLDQHEDARASFFNTEGLDRRDHWAAFGNARVNAMFFNDGYVEVATQDRGPTFLDRFEPDQGNFAGGYGYVDDGGTHWSTAFAWRPRGAQTERRFGMGYGEATTTFRKIRARRRTFAPPGDAPAVISEIELANLDDAPRSLSHYEVWDVARRPVEIDWLASGIPLDSVPEQVRERRDARNGLFVERVEYDSDARLVGLRRSHAPGVEAPPRDAPDPTDYYPGDPFLVALAGDVADVFTDQASFFGAGGIADPDAVRTRAAGDGVAGGTLGDERSGAGQPRVFVLRQSVTLSPGEKRTLRYAYGYAPMGEPWPVDAHWRDADADLQVETGLDVARRLVDFAADREPRLSREMAWHASQLEASVGWREYEKTHLVPQGSAYLYLHGADGAARDVSLFAVPLVFSHPSLAREQLVMNMQLCFAADDRFSYAFQGNGMRDDALGLHAAPSDLDLFFLWAISEYLGATGDLAFLDAKVPYWPREARPDAIVWDHLAGAVRHLFDAIGTGPHGLLRIGTGDWSDGIVLEAPDRDLAVAQGESVPNTQMAVAVLPRVADLVEARDPALAAEIRGRVDALRAAVKKTWTGSFFGRAYFGDGELAYADRINLEAQVWALVGDGMFGDAADRDVLVAAIARDLDDPSPAGATLTTGGQVWPAVSGLLTWGYARSDAERAFRHLARNTMAAHADAFPTVWYGIWSGPDGLQGPAGDRPGESWYSQVTPMTDYPVQNANQHAMPLLALLRVAGLEATAAGVRVDPRIPGDTFSLRTALFDLDRRPGRIAGAYRPSGPRSLVVAAPAGERIAAATLDGAPVAVGPDASEITFDVPGDATFEVTTQAR